MSQSGLHSVKKSSRTKEDMEFEVTLGQQFNSLMVKFTQNPSLETIQKILELNPEYYTMWNRRRELLLLDPEKIPFELPLVEKLLRHNPKSYWIWNHRRWVLENSAEPMWEREVQLLKMMLDLDPRNFHGWDYRRYVMEKSKISSPLEEFDYTTGKIEQNFSNFSAWHYRSKLLTKAFPDKSALNSQIMKDLEFVRNAIFTEPADQSAWLYQRFLLGQNIEPVNLETALLFNSREMGKLVLKFNQKVKFTVTDEFSDIHIIKIDVAHSQVNYEAGQFVGNILGLASGAITITLPTAMPKENNFVKLQFTQSLGITPVPELSTLSDSIWIKELEQIEALVEIEPDSKWALLTLLEFYQHLKKDTRIIIDLLEKLIKIDPFRLGYYNDIKSDIQLADKLSNLSRDSDKLDLSGLGLTRLQPHLSLLMAKDINLENNSLSRIENNHFLSVVKLNLNKNLLSSLGGTSGLDHLKHLSLNNNGNPYLLTQ